MKNLIWLICFLFAACGSDNTFKKLSEPEWTLVSIDSFQLKTQMVFVETVANSNEDKFQLICKTKGETFMRVSLGSPPGNIQLKDLFGDSLPEIVVNDCVGCDLSRLRLFFFNRSSMSFEEFKGTQNLLSEINRLEGTDFSYSVACFNQGGCSSTLVSIVPDSCISIGEMYIPYDGGQIKLTGMGNPNVEEKLDQPLDLDIDTIIPFIWKKKLVEIRSVNEQ